MASGVHREEFKIIMEDEKLNVSEASQMCSSEEAEMTSAVPGKKLCRLITVSIALLCILQAVLSVSLHIAFSNKAHFKNLTEERDKLKRINIDIEARYKNLTEERNELQRINSDIEASVKNLTEEKDKLKRINSDTEIRFKNLSEERDELERELNISVSQHNSLIEEKNNLKIRLSRPEWVYFSGSFYYISSIKKTWQESRNDCLQRGADLMIINSKEEQVFTRQFEKYLWIGLTDLETEETWRWVDGTLLTKSFWGSGEPNGKTSENCVQTKQFTSENNWNDERCSISHYWICEDKINL